MDSGPRSLGSLGRNDSEETMLGHNRKMTGAECLADMLKGYGVTHVFMVPDRKSVV